MKTKPSRAQTFTQISRLRAGRQSNLLMDAVAAVRLAHCSILRTIAIEKDRDAINANLFRAMEEVRLVERLVVPVLRELEQQGDLASLSVSRSGGLRVEQPN